jgi:hypothetical protein
MLQITIKMTPKAKLKRERAKGRLAIAEIRSLRCHLPKFFL